MQYLLTAEQMRSFDTYTCEKIGIGAPVLMERAALACAKEIRKNFSDARRILIICGPGNNGADGLALARIINRLYSVDVLLIPKVHTLSGLVKSQYESAAKSKVRFISEVNFENYDLIVDAIFGIGLSRDIDGIYKSIIEAVNASNTKVMALDMPSGIDTDTGKVCTCAIKADVTVTFAYSKLGQMLFPGADYCGKLLVRDIGIYADLCPECQLTYTYVQNDLNLIPKRRRYSNKGTYGRVLVIAGSADMSGAALLAAKAAYKSGCGLVEVFTHEKIKTVIQTSLPEAIVTSYCEDERDKVFSKLNRSLNTCAAIVIGPGLSKSELSEKIVRYTIENSPCPTVVDADALNIIANDRSLLPYIKECIVTPHLGEMSRLIDKPIADIALDVIKTSKNFSDKYECICVLKDTRTAVCVPNEAVFLNTRGTNGMAKGGSGDVLAGLIASLCAQGMERADAARLGVCLHAVSGELAAKELGDYSMLASDTVDAIGKLMADISDKK